MGRRSRIRDGYERSTDAERRALARRLQRSAGPGQVAELLRGTLGTDEDWRGWCSGVLGGMHGFMPKVRMAAAEAGKLDAEADVFVSLCGTDRDVYWDGAVSEEGFQEWLLARKEIDQPNKGEMNAILRLRTARLTRMGALGRLVEDTSEEAEVILANIVQTGSPRQHAAAIIRILHAEGGYDRLARLASFASLSALMMTNIAVGEGPAPLTSPEAKAVLAAIHDRLWALRHDPATPRGQWLESAWELLPAGIAVWECLSHLGRTTGDYAWQTAYRLLQSSDEEQRAAILAALRGWLELIGTEEAREHLRAEPTEAARAWVLAHAPAEGDIDDRLQDLVWLAVAEYVHGWAIGQLGEAVAAALVWAAEAMERSGQVQLAAPSWTWTTLTRLVYLAGEVCGAGSAELLIHCLDVHETSVYLAAFNSLLSLGDDAVPALRQALRLGESYAPAVIRILERMGVENLEDDLAEGLSVADALGRRQAAQALARRGDERSMPVAIELAASGDPQNRCDAMDIAYRVPCEEGLRLAKHGVDDPHPQVRCVAEVALASQKAYLTDPARWKPPPRSGFPVIVRGAAPEHWETYLELVRGNPVLLETYDKLAEDLLNLTDEEYLKVRAACLADASGRLKWFLYDILGETGQIWLLQFATYRGLALEELPSSETLFEAFARVDEQHLAEEWEKGHADLILGSESCAQWTLAVLWNWEEALVARVGKVEPSADVARAGKDEAVRADWNWVSLFSNLYWGLAVRPSVSLQALTRFVLKYWREASGRPLSRDGRIVREIVDYLVTERTVRPGPKAWKASCLEALWDCFTPLTDALWRDVLRQSKAVGVKTPPRDEFKRLVRASFERYISDYDAFHTSPSEPLFPFGLLQIRSANWRLPKGVYGRSIPLAHYLDHRFREDFLPQERPRDIPSDRLDSVPDTGASSPEEIVVGVDVDDTELDEDELGGPAPSDREPDGGTGDKERDAETLLPEPIVDDSGRQWLGLPGLAKLLRVSPKVLRSEARRGFLEIHRLGRLQVIPYDLQRIEMLKAEIIARSVLRHPSMLREDLGVSERTIRIWLSQAPEGMPAGEKLLYLRDRAQQRKQ
jgi:hypothetical protein